METGNQIRHCTSLETCKRGFSSSLVSGLCFLNKVQRKLNEELVRGETGEIGVPDVGVVWSLSRSGFGNEIVKKVGPYTQEVCRGTDRDTERGTEVRSESRTEGCLEETGG